MRPIAIAITRTLVAVQAFLEAFRRWRAPRSPGATTGHVVLYECPMPGNTVSKTPPLTIRGARDAVERFIPLEEFGELFGGYALWRRSRRPTEELPGQAVGVWSRRMCRRFCRVLRERGATVEVRRDAGPVQSLARLSASSSKDVLSHRDKRRLYAPRPNTPGSQSVLFVASSTPPQT